MVDLAFEERLWKMGLRHIAGIDEAGRGPLAGPVVAAAVVLPSSFQVDGIDDSKKLTANQRQRMFEEICRYALAIGKGCVSHSMIDQVNIQQATFRAMVEAV